MQQNAPHILFWGTADLGKPRTRILLTGLQKHDAIAGECLFNLWGGIEDKSQIKNPLTILRLAINWIVAYPVLIARYLFAPNHDTVVVGYMGVIDVIVLWPFAKLRGARIVWDAFLSLYDTVIDDRAMVKKDSIIAHIIRLVEGTACNIADIVILDTEEHARYFRTLYNLSEGKVISVWVGAETDHFLPRESEREAGKFNVLFYGQFIPLHGINTIIEAARLVNDATIRWTIIGKGQESGDIAQSLAQNPVPSVTMTDWVDYDVLPERIAGVDLCLGIFGTSAKASRVIPNKVFQILGMGKPLITLDSPAIREIISNDMPGIWLVPAGDAEALAAVVEEAKSWLASGTSQAYPAMKEAISPPSIAATLIRQLEMRP